MIGQAGQMITQIVDNAMLGQYNTTSLAASAFSQNIFNVFFVFGLGFTIGITPMVGRAHANNDTEKMGKLLKSSTLINMLLSLILYGFLFGISFHLAYFNQPATVVENTKEYYPWLSASLLPIMLYFTAKHFLDGAEDTKPMMYITIIGNLVNLLLNYLLIYGNWGFTELGLEGAGIATFIARVFQGLGLFGYIFLVQKYKPVCVHVFKGWLLRKDMIKLIKLSTGIGLQLLVEVSAFAIGAILVGTLGEIELAAHQIAIGLASFTFLVASGISTAATIRSSNLIGAQAKVDKIRITIRASLFMVALFMGTTGISFMLFGEFLSSLHSDSVQVVSLGTKLLFIGGIFQLVDGLQVCLSGLLRGFEDVKIPTLYGAFSYLIASLGLGSLFVFQTDLGAQGMWYGFCIGLASMAILLFFRLRTITRRYAAEQP
jgi:MATE family multidrug resistance protein